MFTTSTESLYKDQFYLVVKKLYPTLREQTVRPFKALDARTWISLVIMIYMFGLTIEYMQHGCTVSLANPLRLLSSLLTTFYEAMTAFVTYQSSKPTNSSPGEKFTFVFFITFSVIMLALISASMTSILVNESLNIAFESLDDVIMSPEVSICLHTIIHDTFLDTYPQTKEQLVPRVNTTNELLEELLGGSCDVIIVTDNAYIASSQEDLRYCENTFSLKDEMLLNVDVVVPISHTLGVSENIICTVYFDCGQCNNKLPFLLRTFIFLFNDRTLALI